MDTDAGLLVPVIRDVPALGLQAVGGAIARTDRARARRGELATGRDAGRLFTITNLGAFGIDAFTPIINPPECAVLGVGRIERRPVMDGDRVVGREHGHAEPDVRPPHRGRRPGRPLPANAARSCIENPGP